MKQNTKLKINEFSSQFEFYEQDSIVTIVFPNELVLTIKNDSVFTEKGQVALSDLNFALASSTHAGYFLELNTIERMEAIGTPMQYIVDSVLRSEIEVNAIPEFMSGMELDAEMLIENHVNVLCYYPFGFSENALLNASKIIQIPVAEYLEEHPLGQLEWLYVFGALTGKLPLAKELVAQRKTIYFELIDGAKKTDIRFYLDVPFKGEWHMAPANSSRVRMMEDLGMTYYFASEEAGQNILVNDDELLLHSNEKDYWVIQTAVFTSLDDVIEQRNPHLFELPSYKKGNVFYCNTLTSPIFEKGYNVHPEHVAKDIYRVMILQDTAYSPYFYKKVNH